MKSWLRLENLSKSYIQLFALFSLIFQTLLMVLSFRYEYDSDEEVDDQGTWEHKKRLLEMEKTKGWAEELTTHAKGKHHLGYPHFVFLSKLLTTFFLVF